jgi:ureidoglycolate hydrolase
MTHSQRVVLEWDGEWWTVSDEGGEFARATEPHQALSYASDLMHGPPTTIRAGDALAWVTHPPVHGKTERLSFPDEEWASDPSGPSGF